MNSSTQKQARTLKEKAKELELTGVDSTEIPVKIHRILTLFRESAAAEASHEIGEHSGASPQRNKKSRRQGPHLAETSRRNARAMKLDDSHPSFGPIYSMEHQSFQAMKEKAWEHVMKKSTKKQSSPSPTRRNEEEDEEEREGLIMQIYSTAMRNVEDEAKKIYAVKISGTESSFRWMMIKDGCFFLQLAFLILGGSKQLGYPWDDSIFGEKENKKDVRKWIEAMFYVGNQIPLIVLKELMKQSFFQNVVEMGKWKANPLSLCQQVLYYALFSSPKLNHQQQPPSDLLHLLQKLLLGPAPPDHLDEADDQIDLEAANDLDEEIDGLYGTILATPMDNGGDDGEGGRDIRGGISVLLKAIGLGSAIEDHGKAFPSATELKRASIYIKKLKSGGARSIHLKSCYFWAYLYLPAFLVDDYTEVLLQNLKMHEISQVGRKRYEVASYLKVMSDIVQTRKDTKILKDKGVVCVSSSDYVDKLPGILNRLNSRGEIFRLTHEFRILRQQISDYSSPLIHYRSVINIVVGLTIIQTIVALTAYIFPRST